MPLLPFYKIWQKKNFKQIVTTTADRVKFMGLWIQSFRQGHFIHHVSFIASASLFKKILNTVQWILLARWLGPHLIGVVALVETYPSMIYTVLDPRASALVIKYLSQFHTLGQNRRAVALCNLGFFIEFALGCTCFIIVWATANWAARNIVQHQDVAYLILLYAAARIPQSLSYTGQAILTVLEKFPLIAYFSTVRDVVQFAMIVLFVISGWSVAGVIWGHAIGSVIGGILFVSTGLYYIRRTWGLWPWNVSMLELQGQIKNIFTFLIYNNLIIFSNTISRYWDLTILGYFAGPTATGYYRLAKSIALIGNFFNPSLESVIFPRLARSWSLRQLDTFKQTIQQMAFVVGPTIGLIVAFGTFILAPILILMVAGSKFLSAILTCQISCIATFFWLTVFWFRPFLLATDQAPFYLILSVILSFIRLLAFAVGASLGGHVGVAISWVFIEFIGAVVCYTKLLYSPYKWNRGE